MLLIEAPNKWGQTSINFLNALPVELRLRASSVNLQCALLAHRVWTLEDPVLPSRQTTEDARQHGLGAGEAQARFHAGEGVGREARAFLNGEADFLIPVDVIGR